MPRHGDRTLSSGGQWSSSQDTPGSTADAANQSSSPSHPIPLDPYEIQTRTHPSSSLHIPCRSHQQGQPQLTQLESFELPKQPFFYRLTTRLSLHPSPDRHQHKLTKADVRKFMLDTFPAHIYLYFLLRLPTLYCSCVDQIIEEADKTLPDIKKMALETHEFVIQMAFEPSKAPPACKKLTSIWEPFIDSLMREWNTFNIILAILTVLHIQSAQAAEDPLIRYTALLSLICALISLLFGCTYIVHFGSMREPWKAIEWAQEAKKSQTCIWWNVRIMLAMPAIWLNWFVILYISCIMSLVWRSGGTSSTPLGISDTRLLVIRIAITVILGIGVIYGFLTITTFRRSSGVVMEEAWNRRIDRWIEEKDHTQSDNQCL